MTNSIQIISSGDNLQAVSLEGALNCKMQELLTPQNSAPNFSMRLFDIAVDGHTPQHSHPWEHEVFILEGEGELRGEQILPFKAGSAILVQANTLHQFYNSGSQPLKFLCLIPNNANYQNK